MRPQDIVDAGLEQLADVPGTVLVEVAESVNLRWANSTLTTNGAARSQRVHVVAQPEVPGGQASGSASGVVSDRSELSDLVARAVDVARGAGPARDAADLVPGTRDGGWEQPAGAAGPDDLVPVSQVLGAVLPGPDVAHFGYAEQDVTTTYLGTSAGVRRRHEQPTARFELCGKSPDRTRSAWAGRSGRHLADLDLAGTEEEIQHGLAVQARHIDVPPGRHRVLLSPSAAADLLVYLLWSAGALDAVEGRSAFAGPEGTTAVGRRLADLPVWLRSDPHAPGLQCADHVRATTSGAVTSSFDAGMPLAATDWVADGVLRSLLTTRYSARRAGLPDTPASDNLIAGVSGRSGSLEELAARTGDGLLVTCLWYIREVDAQRLLLTGLTRDGVYVVRDGEIVGAAGNYRFNDSPLGMLDRIVDAGTPTDCLPREWADWFTRARVAPLAVDEFNLSTRSEAV